MISRYYVARILSRAQGRPQEWRFLGHAPLEDLLSAYAVVTGELARHPYRTRADYLIVHPVGLRTLPFVATL